MACECVGTDGDLFPGSQGLQWSTLLGMCTKFSKSRSKEGLLLNVSLPNLMPLGEEQGKSGRRADLGGNVDLTEWQWYLPPLCL